MHLDVGPCPELDDLAAVEGELFVSAEAEHCAAESAIALAEVGEAGWALAPEKLTQSGRADEAADEKARGARIQREEVEEDRDERRREHVQEKLEAPRTLSAGGQRSS